MAELTSARIALCAQALPGIFFVLQLRDPLDRMVSALAMASCTFGNVKNGCRLDESYSIMDNFPLKSQHVYKGMYGTALKRWTKYVPQERILVFFFEELSADPLSVVNKVLVRAGLEAFREMPRNVPTKPPG